MAEFTRKEVGEKVRLNESLEGADLSGLDLAGANLSFAHLEDANLSYAFLMGANLRWSYLDGADLRSCQPTCCQPLFRETEGCQSKKFRPWTFQSE